MRRFTICLTILSLAACAKSDEQAAESAAAPATTPAPAPAPLTLASVAGTWNVKAMPENSDSTLTTIVLKATADSTGWTMSFPNREPIAMNVTAAGDSIVAEAGPYDSQLRKGQKVHTVSVMRMQGDKMVGRTTAHYMGTKADTAHLRTEGTRAP